MHILNLQFFQINPPVMEAALSPDMLATDLAYYLVKKGVSGNNFALKCGTCCVTNVKTGKDSLV